MKKLSLFSLLLLFAGCLVPGAPHHFNYQSQNNTLKATSYPHNIEYYYRPQQKSDSAFLLEPQLNTFKKMTWDENENCYRYSKNEKMINNNLRRIMKINTIVISTYINKKTSYDTLLVKPDVAVAVPATNGK